MKVGVIQSSFIPWRGYFDLIASVDLFIFYDDTQYTKGGWRNRNRLKTEDGLGWITVPVHQEHLSQRICDTAIVTSDWRARHKRLWQFHYRGAPYLYTVLDILDHVFENPNVRTISQLNIALIHSLCDYLDIHTHIVMAQDYAAQGSRMVRLLDLLTKAKATHYLSGPTADAYLDREAFHRANIGLSYKSYDYAPYPQLWGPFQGGVTVLDLIANCGLDARRHYRSQSPDRVIVPGPALIAA